MKQESAAQREKRERERESAGCRKLEGRRSRPGLVLGLADSLALSQRNASNAGEPLLSPSFSSFCLPPLSLTLSFPPRARPENLSEFSSFLSLSPCLRPSRSRYPPLFPPPGLPFIQFTLSFVAIEGEKATRRVAPHTRRLFRLALDRRYTYYCLFYFSLSLSLKCAFFNIRETKCRPKERERECKVASTNCEIILSPRGGGERKKERMHLRTRRERERRAPLPKILA